MRQASALPGEKMERRAAAKAQPWSNSKPMSLGLGDRLRPGQLLAVGGERVISRLLVDEDLLGERRQRLVGEQAGGEGIEVGGDEPVEKVAAAAGAKATLGPVRGAVAGDMGLALDFDGAAALDAEQRRAAPFPAHRAVAGLDMPARRARPHRHRAAQAMPLDRRRLDRHPRLLVRHAGLAAPARAGKARRRRRRLPRPAGASRSPRAPPEADGLRA